MKMKKILALTLAATTAASLLVTGCGAKKSADGKVKATMAFCTWTGYSPMFIALNQGYFDEAGIEMDIQVIEDESTYASLITKGDVQFLGTAQDPNVKMFANGASSKYMFTMDQSFGADGLVAVSDIKSLDDLKGRTVALDKSASSYYFFLQALERGSSLTEDDIDVIDMGDTTEAGVAFMGGQVDSAIMWEPELSEAIEMVDGAHIVVSSADYPDTISDSLVVNAAFAEKNPEAVKAVEEAWYKAIDFMKANPAKAYEDMASGFEEVSAEDVEADSEGLKFLGRDENAALKDASNSENIYDMCKNMASFWMSKGECKTDVLDDYFTLIK